MDNLNTQRTEKKKRSWDEVLQNRLRVVENPNSIVIAARTREGLILSDLTYNLDRAVSRIRRNSGTFIPVQSVIEALKKVDNFIKEFSQFVNSVFADGGIPIYESFETKKALVSSFRRALVFNPRSQEAREVAHLVKRLDPSLVEFRNTCTDFSRSEQLFKKLIDLIIKFDFLVNELFSLLKIPYTSSKTLKALLRAISGGESQELENNEKEIQFSESQEEVPRKGKKVGGIA